MLDGWPVLSQTEDIDCVSTDLTDGMLSVWDIVLFRLYCVVTYLFVTYLFVTYLFVCLFGFITTIYLIGRKQNHHFFLYS